MEPIADRFFRMLVETDLFEALTPQEREAVLLAVTQKCIAWVVDREHF